MDKESRMHKPILTAKTNGELNVSVNLLEHSQANY